MTFLYSIAPIILTLLIVFWLRYKKFLTEDAKTVIATLNFKVLAPLVVFSAILKSDFRVSNIKVAIVASVIVLILLLVGSLLVRSLKVTRSQQGALLFAFVSSAITSFAYPFALQFFDSEVIKNIIIIDSVLFPVALFLVLPFVAFQFGKKQDAVKDIVQKIITNYVFVAAIAGYLFVLLGIQLSPDIFVVLEFLTKAFPFLAIVFVGLNLNVPSGKSVKVSIFLIISYILVGSIGILFSSIMLGLSRPEYIALALSLLAPVAPFMVGLAKEEGYDVSIMSQMLIFSMIFTLALYMLIAVFL